MSDFWCGKLLSKKQNQPRATLMAGFETVPNMLNLLTVL